MKKLFGVVLGFALVLILGVATASADSIAFNIGVPNDVLSAFTGPYASVTVNQLTSTTASLVFTSLTTNGTTFLMSGGGTAAAFNVNGTFSVGTITPTFLSGFGPATFNNGGAVNNVSAFGGFNGSLNGPAGYTNAANSLTIGLTATGGTTWANALSVLTPNAAGFTTAIHGFACTAPCQANAGALATGFAGNGSSVPEPASLLLLGTGLAGIGLWRRRNQN